MPEPEEELRVWRIPAYQPALLMLVLVGAAALNIYSHPSATARIATLAFGLLCGALSVAALRFHLVATREGISIRQLRGEEWISWPELDDIEVIDNVRGAPTLRLNRRDGTYVEVPPSLLQPTRPTSKRAVMARLGLVANQLEQRRRAYRAAG